MARMTASASSDPLDPLPFRAGDGPGGTGHMVELARGAGNVELVVADPATL
mgnify:CR=1 FL=1